MNIGHVFRAENTLLPPPSEKEAVAVFLRLTRHFCCCLKHDNCGGRVKPRTEREREIMKENWGERGVDNKEEEEVVRVETEHQVALLAPKESQAFKNSMNGVGKMTYRQVHKEVNRLNIQT